MLDNSPVSIQIWLGLGLCILNLISKPKLFQLMKSHLIRPLHIIKYTIVHLIDMALTKIWRSTIIHIWLFKRCVWLYTLIFLMPCKYIKCSVIHFPKTTQTKWTVPSISGVMHVWRWVTLHIILQIMLYARWNNFP